MMPWRHFPAHTLVSHPHHLFHQSSCVAVEITIVEMMAVLAVVDRVVVAVEVVVVIGYVIRIGILIFQFETSSNFHLMPLPLLNQFSNLLSVVPLYHTLLHQFLPPYSVKNQHNELVAGVDDDEILLSI